MFNQFRTKRFDILRYVMYFFNEHLFISSSSSIILTQFVENLKSLKDKFYISPKFNRNRLLIFNKNSDVEKVRIAILSFLFCINMNFNFRIFQRWNFLKCWAWFSSDRSTQIVKRHMRIWSVDLSPSSRSSFRFQISIFWCLAFVSSSKVLKKNLWKYWESILLNLCWQQNKNLWFFIILINRL